MNIEQEGAYLHIVCTIHCYKKLHENLMKLI